MARAKMYGILCRAQHIKITMRREPRLPGMMQQPIHALIYYITKICQQ